MLKYARQEKIIGQAAQQKLQQSKVVIIGIGALGTVAASLLARSGIGELILIDRDIVEESNLQRQLLFIEADVGKSKAVCAADRLRQINPQIKITAQALHLNANNIINIINLKEYSRGLVIDCTDNFKTKFLINDYCKQEKIPLVYGSAIKQQGQVMLVSPMGPCLSCFLKETTAETCEQVGVLNTITTLIGSLQADLALKTLIGWKLARLAEKKPNRWELARLTDKRPAARLRPTAELYHFDLEKNSFRVLTVKPDENCPACRGNYHYLNGNHHYLNSKSDAAYIRFCSSGKYQIEGQPLDLEELKARLELIGPTIYDGTTLKFKNILLFADGRALIAASSEEEAQSSYSKYVGN